MEEKAKGLELACFYGCCFNAFVSGVQHVGRCCAWQLSLLDSLWGMSSLASCVLKSVSPVTPTWLHTLREMSPLERDFLTGWQASEKVPHLRSGLVGRVPPVKTVYGLSSQLQGHSVGEVVALNACPKGFKVHIRVEESKAAYRYLLEVSEKQYQISKRPSLNSLNTLLKRALTPVLSYP